MSGPRAASSLAVVLGVALLVGCTAAPTTPAIDPALSGELSSAVVAVASRASTGDYAGALVLLDELEARVESAAAQDQITSARLVTLDASLARTRADLEVLLAAATPTVAPSAPVVGDPGTVEEGPADTGDNGNGNGDEKDKEKKDK